jgi:uncharacterized membrane protein YdjX (TVP38/TMEM64 family)
MVLKRRVVVGGALVAAAIAVAAVLSWNGSAYHFLLRLSHDEVLLRQTLQEWGVLGPVIFIVFQAFQVLLSPIPGEATGFLGGYLFGLWPGFIYSTIGLTLGSVAAFGVGRWLGIHFVQNLVRKEHWDRMGFIVEAEGAILCFVLFLLPGVPKDMACYLFGLSPMPFWVFAVVSTLGRVPTTWGLSAEGAHAAVGEYVRALFVAALMVAVALPLYYYRDRIVTRFRRTPVPHEP